MKLAQNNSSYVLLMGTVRRCKVRFDSAFFSFSFIKQVVRNNVKDYPRSTFEKDVCKNIGYKSSKCGFLCFSGMQAAWRRKNTADIKQNKVSISPNQTCYELELVRSFHLSWNKHGHSRLKRAFYLLQVSWFWKRYLSLAWLNVRWRRSLMICFYAGIFSEHRLSLWSSLKRRWHLLVEGHFY